MPRYWKGIHRNNKAEDTKKCMTLSIVVGLYVGLMTIIIIYG